MAELVICPLSKVEEVGQKYRPEAMITILSEPMPVPRPASVAPENHLQLFFDDIGLLLPERREPNDKQIAQLLEFGKKWRQSAPMLIHCLMGISRSTAAAYILACALHPEKSEQDWARELRRQSATASPNRKLIALANKALGREGQMMSAIAAMSRPLPAYEGVPFTLEV